MEQTGTDGGIIALCIIGFLWFISFIFGTVIPSIWANHKKLRDSVPILRENYVGAWDNTEESARFEKVHNEGYSWWGYNARFKCWFFSRRTQNRHVQIDNLTGKTKIYVSRFKD